MLSFLPWWNEFQPEQCDAPVMEAQTLCWPFLEIEATTSTVRDFKGTVPDLHVTLKRCANRDSPTISPVLCGSGQITSTPGTMRSSIFSDRLSQLCQENGWLLCTRGWVSLVQEVHCIPTLGQQFWSQLDFLPKLLDCLPELIWRQLKVSNSTDPRNSVHKPAVKPRHHWRPAYGAQVATMASTSEPLSSVFQIGLERTPLWLHAFTKS